MCFIGDKVPQEQFMQMIAPRKWDPKPKNNQKAWQIFGFFLPYTRNSSFKSLAGGFPMYPFSHNHSSVENHLLHVLEMSTHFPRVTMELWEEEYLTHHPSNP